jgi:sterol desaturase/sphingolipid hydroxylase (fatty acid hydroxylase superfamily)
MLETTFLSPATFDSAVAGLVFAAQAFARVFVGDFLRYLIAAGLVFILLSVVLRGPLRGRRIQSRKPRRGQMRREFLWSVATVSIFATVGIANIASIVSGGTRLYLEIGQYGWGYWVFTVLAMIIAHDAYFYWTHRAMHHPALFRRIHHIHHRSHVPTPWAAYSFAPGEALVHALFVTTMLHLVPLHPLTLLVFGIHQILRNALGHSGYELFPRGASHSRALGWLTMTTHHDLHHSRVSGNYGLYFTWWDRWMGTEIPDYKAVFDRVTAKGGEKTVARTVPAPTQITP